ncbi:MAG: FAD-dependent oxidoreductase, partial [Comamonadaceae bacterium]
MKEEHWDVVVTGAGAAGVAAAVAAARGGARTLLVDAGTMPGGELISGIAMLGAQDALGRWVVGGVARELLAQVDALGGYIGPVFDYRALRLVCFDSELMKLALAPWLADCGVTLRLHSFVHGADCAPDGTVRALRLYAKGGEHRVHAKAFVDASGDADVTRLAGGTVLSVGAGESLQPPSLVFRVVGVDTAALLRMVVQEPGHFGLGELP